MSDTLASFLSGAFGGFSLVLASHPFDLIKVRLQADKQGNLKAASAVKEAISGKYGIFGLYRGVTPVLMGAPIILGSNFLCYSIAQDSLAKRKGISKSQLSILETGIAGGLASVPLALIVAPAEQLKIQLQTSTSSLSQVLRSLLKTSESRRRIGHGIGLTILRDIPGGFFYFATYEFMKRRYPPSEYGAFMIPIAGGSAGVMSWITTLPLDTIKTKVQAAIEPGSIYQIIKSTIKREGLRGLYHGLTPTLLRAFPASSAFFAGVEGSSYFLKKSQS